MASEIASLRRDLRQMLRLFNSAHAGWKEEWACYKRAVFRDLASNQPDLPALAKALRMRLEQRNSRELGDLFDYLLCVEAMLESLERLPDLKVPAQVKELILAEFRARQNDGESRCHKAYALMHTDGINHLKRSVLRWLPLGLYYFEESGIPRSHLWKCRLQQRPAVLKFILFEMGGFKPTYEVHLPQQTTAHLTEDNVYACYRLLASVLKMHPEVKGLCSSAWYYDPVVAQISPRFRFIHDLFLRHGGFVHPLDTTESCVEDALFKSKTRQRLFAEGRYQPRNYARYWPRAALIRWAGV